MSDPFPNMGCESRSIEYIGIPLEFLPMYLPETAEPEKVSPRQKSGRIKDFI
jgi:hypothetical protein